MQWEYTSWQLRGGLTGLNTPDAEEVTKMLNWYGQQGWELVACNDISSSGYTISVTYVFKRPVTRQAPPMQQPSQPHPQG